MSTSNPKLTTAVGFVSPADDFLEKRLDLNEYLVPHPAATFFFRAKGEAMIGAGIFPGDMLIVDRSLKAVNLSVIVAVVEGDLIVRRYRKNGSKSKLTPENNAYPPIEIGQESPLDIWGVVTNVIHKLT